jgi:hypothetical protein
MNADEPTKPAGEIRLGNIKATIWRNDTTVGPRFNTTIERLYKNDQGQWASTSNFGLDDLLLVAKVADHAHTHIHSQKQFDKIFDQT